MIHFKTANARISMWFPVPMGFATGLLAATIAVGGFIGVPGMMYVLGCRRLVATATELVIAFVMGLAAPTSRPCDGIVDIRLAMIILAGSLFGIQIGAIGTTYVKDYVVKFVMAAIMLIVAVSRGLAVPQYLTELKLISVGESTLKVLGTASFIIMCGALGFGALIILGAMWKAKRAETAAKKAGGFAVIDDEARRSPPRIRDSGLLPVPGPRGPVWWRWTLRSGSRWDRHRVPVPPTMRT